MSSNETVDTIPSANWLFPEREYFALLIGYVLKVYSSEQEDGCNSNEEAGANSLGMIMSLLDVLREITSFSDFGDVDLDASLTFFFYDSMSGFDIPLNSKQSVLQTVYSTFKSSPKF